MTILDHMSHHLTNLYHGHKSNNRKVTILYRGLKSNNLKVRRNWMILKLKD